jgi:hypothetical protein
MILYGIELCKSMSWIHVSAHPRRHELNVRSAATARQATATGAQYLPHDMNKVSKRFPDSPFSNLDKHPQLAEVTNSRLGKYLEA